MKKLVFAICFLFISSTVQAALRVRFDDKKNQLILIDGKVQNNLPIDMPKGFFLDGDLSFFQSDKMVLVQFPINDGEAGTTIIYALNMKAKKLWEYDMGGFNPAKPLIEKKHVYLGALSKVAKLEKMSGKVIWVHEGLYENPRIQYEGSTPVKRVGKKIHFAGNLEVDDKSGKIAKVHK